MHEEDRNANEKGTKIADFGGLFYNFIIYTHCVLSWLTSWLFLTYLVTISLTSEDDTVELL